MRTQHRNDHSKENPVNHRTIEGRVEYTSRKVGMEGQNRGFETFMFTHHGDGKVIMRAHCEINEPKPSVMRDIIYVLDENKQPMDLHVHLTVGGAFMGSGWMRFDGTHVEMESYGPAIGRLSQKVQAELPLSGFGTHPIVSDGYMLSYQDWKSDDKLLLNCYLPSSDHRGATPPQIAHVKIGAVYLGNENVTVPAGTFPCRHFQFVDDASIVTGTGGMAGEHPPYDIWITDDEDGICVQGGVGGYMMTWYELVALKR
jgi:hypothetical protein